MRSWKSRRAELEQLDRNFVRDRRALVEDRGVVMQERRRLIDIEIAKVIEKIAVEREYAMVLNPFVVLPAGNRTYTHTSFFYANEEKPTLPRKSFRVLTTNLTPPQFQ